MICRTGKELFLRKARTGLWAARKKGRCGITDSGSKTRQEADEK